MKNIKEIIERYCRDFKTVEKMQMYEEIENEIWKLIVKNYKYWASLVEID